MKRWAMLTVGLYVLILLILAGPVVCLCFIGDGPGLAEGCMLVYGAAFGAMADDGPDQWILITLSPWTWALVMGLGQAALLVVPVRIASRKPVTTRWLI